MTQTNDIVVAGNDVWLATGGGALHYDRTSQTYRRFTRLDGLGGNQLLSVAIDENGIVWFGSAAKGLSRLQAGASHFDPPFLEFRDRDILSLFADGDRLYVGTDRGLSVFLLEKQEVKESYRRLGTLAKDAAVNALTIHDGIIFVGTSEGLAWASLSQPNLQDPDSWSSALNVGQVKDVIAIGNNVMAGSSLGIFSYDPTADRFFLDFDGEAVDGLGSFEGRALAATDEGNFLQRLGAGIWRRIGAPLIFDVRGVSEINDGSVWLATETGLRTIRAETPASSGEPGSSRFYDLRLVDGDLWAASVPDDQQRILSAGVYQLHDGTWTVFDESSGMPNDELVAIETDSQGRIWIGSWGGGIAIRQSDRWFELDETNSVLRGIGPGADFVAISDVQRDVDGNLWIVNVAVGIAVIDNYPQTQGYLFDQVALGQSAGLDLFRIGLARDGHKWVASRTDGLVILDDGGTPFTGGDDRIVVINQLVEPRLSSNRTFDLLEDDDGTLWLATDSGLNAIGGSYDRSAGEFRASTWRVYCSLDGLPSDEINALEIDGDGHLWVGTSAGLSRIDNGEVAITLTSTNSGLINDRVTGLLFDAEANELWVGTFDGLNRLRLGTASSNGEDPVSGSGVFPNPFVTDGHQQLTFAGLPLGATLEIYTLHGELVTSLQAGVGRGSVSWSGLNDAGFLVGSGIYFYVAQAPSSEIVRGRFAIVDGAPQ
ncbi:MAG: T9SS type A sorting domain-containing protein [Gemmatimonadetes bacterium]|nr:T9SS type A sorting domain-containing protein [Gemmatimonadota bacterium]